MTFLSDDVQVSELWAIEEEKGERGGGNISSPISLSNTFYTNLNQQITFYWTTFVAFYMSTELNVEYIDTNCRSNVATLYLYTRTVYVYRRILKFFKQAGNSRI